MNINPIKTEADYDQALAEIDALFEAAPDTPEGDRLDVLMTLVEAYERKHHPVGLPDPIAAIEYYMECKGMSEAGLEPYIGSRSLVSAVLHRREPLTIEMIRKLYQGLGIPVEILIQSLVREWDNPLSSNTVDDYQTSARRIQSNPPQSVEASLL